MHPFSVSDKSWFVVDFDSVLGTLNSIGSPLQAKSNDRKLPSEVSQTFGKNPTQSLANIRENSRTNAWNCSKKKW